MKRYIFYILLLLSLPLMAQEPLSLDSCLELTRLNHASIRKAHLKVEQAQEVRKQALTKYFPQVQAMGVGYHSLYPLVEIGVDDLSNESLRNVLNFLYEQLGERLGVDNALRLGQYGYHVGVMAVQPVFMGGKIIAGNRLSKLGVQAAELQEDMAIRDAMEEVEEAYWLCLGLKEKQRTIASALSLLDTVTTMVSAASSAGLALPSDLLQIELRQSETKRLSLQLNNGLYLATRALALAIGLDTVSLPSSIDEMDSITMPMLLAEQSAQSPEAQLLALQVRAAELERRMDLGDALPQLAVGANYGYGNLQANILNNGFGAKNGNGAVFVTLSIPLTQWWETAHKLREHDLNIESARIDEEDLTAKLRLRDEQLYLQMLEAFSLLDEAQVGYRKAEESFRLQSSNYRAGLSTITDLLSAETALLQAANSLTDARIATRLTTRKYLNRTKNSRL